MAKSPAPQLGSFCHVEIATANMARAKKFYGKLFGWKFQDMPGAPGGYTLFEAPGGPGGGISGCDQKTLPPVLNYILVDKVDAYVKKVEKAGGSLAEAKQEVPGFGWYMVVLDPDGNRLGLWQPMPPRPARKAPARKPAARAKKKRV